MTQEAMQATIFLWLPIIGLIFYFYQRNSKKKLTGKSIGNEKLVHNLGNRGEKLIHENIHGDKIIVKLQGISGQGLVITDKRLYVLKWGYLAGNFFGGRCIGFEYKNIVGLEIRKSWSTGTIQVLTPSNQDTQKTYWGKGGNDALRSDNTIAFGSNKFQLFQEAVKIGRELLQNSNTHVASRQQSSNYSDLEKLAELKEKGIVTQEEFEAKKKMILGLKCQ